METSRSREATISASSSATNSPDSLSLIEPMKRICAALLGGLLSLSAACHDFLDVNTNPNGPQTVTANLYLAPMEHWMVTAPQYDVGFVGRYTQEWTLPPNSTWDQMGYDKSRDNG